MASGFESLLEYGESMGVFNVLMPFLLVFAITFAVLEKLDIFKGKRQINGIVAAVFGILVIRNQYVVGIITKFLPNISLFMIVILMFLLLIGTFVGEHKNWNGKYLHPIAIIVSVIFVIWSLSADYIGSKWALPSFLTNLDETTKAGILFIAMFVGVIWFVTRQPNPNPPPARRPAIDLGSSSSGSQP